MWIIVLLLCAAAIILSCRTFLIWRRKGLSDIDRAIGLVGILLGIIGTLSFFLGEKYIPTFVVKIIVIVMGIGMFLFIGFWPRIYGNSVKKKLGKPCKIGLDRIQYYISRRDLPLEDLVRLSKQEIIFVSVTHEIVAPDKDDIIKQAIENRSIKVKVMILDSRSQKIQHKERVFGIGAFARGKPDLSRGLEERIRDSLTNLEYLRTQLPEEKRELLTIETYDLYFCKLNDN